MIGRTLGVVGWLAFFAWLAQGCAVFQAATPAERAAQALQAVDLANEAAERACDVYATGVATGTIKADPTVTGRCNARILDRE